MQSRKKFQRSKAYRRHMTEHLDHLDRHGLSNGKKARTNGNHSAREADERSTRLGQDFIRTALSGEDQLEADAERVDVTDSFVEATWGRR
jgi:hypothetical protein